MKFGALLRNSSREVPELQGLFDCYKQLKKRLKRLPARGPGAGAPGAPDAEAARARGAFVALLVADIQAFNDTFVEREEQSVIQLSLLEERAAVARQPEQVAAVYKSFVDFHGQTLLLVHWSILAYTSVLKILKKHYKRTGLRVQELSTQQLLSQPFCSVELISGLVRKAEDKAQELSGRLNPATGQASLSAASPGSSPVADLIDAARASVQQIADSAACGDAALDRHLDGPTSSDEASRDAQEGEVISGPSRNHGAGAANGAARPEQQPAHAAAAQPEGAGDGTEADSAQAGQKRGGGGAAAGPQRAAKQACTGESIPLTAEASAGRTGAARWGRPRSVGRDSEQPGLDPPANGGGEEPEAGGRQAEAAAQQGQAGMRERRARGLSRQASRGSQCNGAGGPQLTMGQGWGAAGPRNILRQTQMALGLWEELHTTASTPSTVVPPLKDASQGPRGSANSAA